MYVTFTKVIGTIRKSRRATHSKCAYTYKYGYRISVNFLFVSYLSKLLSYHL
jgi:hypothetical protein